MHNEPLAVGSPLQVIRSFDAAIREFLSDLERGESVSHGFTILAVHPSHHANLLDALKVVVLCMRHNVAAKNGVLNDGLG